MDRRTGSPWRDLPGSFGHWNSTFKRFRDWVKPMFSSGCSMPSRTTQTWNTPWSTPHRQGPPHGRAQKGDFEPGHRQFQRRHDDQNPGADRCLGNLVRFVLLPGQRFDTVGVAPLIDGIDFDALIADKASTPMRCRRSRRARRKGRHLPASAPRFAAADRRGDVQMATPDRELLLQAQGVQTHRHARRQDRPKLHRHDPLAAAIMIPDESNRP